MKATPAYAMSLTKESEGTDRTRVKVRPIMGGTDARSEAQTTQAIICAGLPSTHLNATSLCLTKVLPA